MVLWKAVPYNLVLVESMKRAAWGVSFNLLVILWTPGWSIMVRHEPYDSRASLHSPHYFPRRLLHVLNEPTTSVIKYTKRPCYA